VDGTATGNSLLTTHGRGAREDLWEEGPDRWVPAVSVGGAVMGGWLGLRMEMG
jgi:hypothetical protein